MRKARGYQKGPYCPCAMPVLLSDASEAPIWVHDVFVDKL